MAGELHPRPGASMMPHSSRPSPSIDKNAPIASGREESGFFELGTSQIAPMIPSAAMGTLTRNTEPHQKCASRNPPRIGPRATPIPVVPDQMPMARTRSRSAVKTLARIESVQGISAAAPTPMVARATVKTSGVGDHAANAEPPPKTTRPPINTHFRPARSPKAPSDRSRPAKTTA